MTPEVAIRHVDEAIMKASRHQSWIDESILSLTGFSTGVMRRLVSNICHLPKENPSYLEIGLYAGATFCSAICNNPTLSACGIEDFSQPFGNDKIRQELAVNIEQYKKGARMVDVIDADCFTMKAHRRKVLMFDAYFYDGEHSFESQAKALPHFIDAMATVFIFMVDDAHWSTVREGTKAGFEALKDRVKIERKWALDGEKQQDDPVWWNGMEIYVCSKV